MEEVVLYACSNATNDPAYTLVTLWAKQCQIRCFSIELTSFTWNSAGELPVLRVGSYVIPKANILDFLKFGYNINRNLTQNEVIDAGLVEEMCVSKLYPGILYALWMDDTTSKHFYQPAGHWVWKLLVMPAVKISFILDKRRMREYLIRQHRTVTPEQALLVVDEAHSLLSRKLGGNRFFLTDHVSSADIVVFAYLEYELSVLPDHPFVLSSLKKYVNLVSFIEMMRNLEDTSEVHLDEAVKTHSQMERYIYKNTKKTRVYLQNEETKLSKRLFITGVAVIIFLFLRKS